jgi:hypothetical protein
LPAAKRYGVTAYADETKRAFAWVHLDFLESKSYRGLSINARRVLERLLIENTRHRYKENGNLRVSSRQFAGSLNGRRHIAKAIHELQESGLLDITKGKPNGKFAAPNLYRLKFLGTIDGPSTWRQRERDAIPEKTIPTTQKWSTPATRKWSTRIGSAAAIPSGEPTQKQTKNLTKGGPSITSSPETAPPDLVSPKPRQKSDREPEKERVAFFCAKSAMHNCGKPLWRASAGG